MRASRWPIGLVVALYALSGVDALAQTAVSLPGEIARAKAAEAQLQTNINNEASARAQGDAATLGLAKAYSDAKVVGLATIPVCRGRPGGECSATQTQACAYDKDCPTGEMCRWAPGTCSTTPQACVSDSVCPTGETCSNPRFVDNGNRTVTDRRTCLTWRKEDLEPPGYPDPHADYPRFAEPTHAAGTLKAFNESLLGGHADWRLPTSGGWPDTPFPDGPGTCASGNDPELESIVDPSCPYGPSGSSKCVDPVFGPTRTFLYLTSSSIRGCGGPGNWWSVSMTTGEPSPAGFDSDQHGAYMRAVRGGPGVP
jgi:hypothetical protein